MRFFRKFIICVFALLLPSSVFAAGGLMHGETNIQMVQTQWFDIIYGEECADSAAVLYANADKIYLDLAEMYGWKNGLCRMPVVLTTQVEDFNAYYSSGFYNHIVLYVTNPIVELENQQDGFLWTFRHELTHAFTYNMKNDFFKTIDKIFSDSISLSLLTVTPGVAEGATLTSESFEGNGRLNDEFAKHTVKQAKIEGLFPNFSDVQGSKDIYPSGDFYAFNGAFHEYLQKNYGLEKYAKFWYNCVNNSLWVSSAFRKAYGFSLTRAWNDFKYEYKVPSINANPIQTGYVKDFFVPSFYEYSKLNNKGAVIGDYLSVSEKGLTYIDLKTSTVFFVDNESFTQNSINPQKLFQKYGLERAVQSVDGKYIAVTYVDDKADTYKSHIAVYNTESKKWYEPKDNGLKDAIIVQSENEYYLVSLSFKGEHKNIRISKLYFDEKGEVNAEDLPISLEFGRNQQLTYITPVSDGVFAYIMNDELNYSIQLMDIEGNIIADYPVPAGDLNPHFLIRHLSYDDKNDELLFTWVCQDTMPRAGKLDLETGEYILSNEDISGGVFNPVVFEDEIVYIGKFYQQSRLFRMEDGFKDSLSYYSNEVSEEEFEEDQEANSDDLNYLRKNFDIGVPVLTEVTVPKKYNPLNYMKRGMWLPIGNVASKSYDSEHYGTYDLSTGLTYMTRNPWDSFDLMLSVGYGAATNSVGMSATFADGTDTDLFKWSTGVFSEFDVNGFKACEVEGSFSSVLKANNYSRFIISPSVFTHVGRSNKKPVSTDNLFSDDNNTEDFTMEDINSTLGKLFGYARSDSMDLYLFSQEYVTLAFNNIRKVDDNRFAYEGFTLGCSPVFKISRNLTANKADYVVGDFTLFGEIYIPRLISTENTYGQTTNLPVKIFASMFSASSVSSNYITLPIDIIGAKVPDFALVATEVILYGKEFQKAISFFPWIFINDLKISFVGAFGYDYPGVSSYDFYLGFMQTPQAFKGIANGTLQPVSIFSMKFALGGNYSNFGTYARNALKSYIYVSPAVYLKDTVTVYCDVGIDINF